MTIKQSKLSNRNKVTWTRRNKKINIIMTSGLRESSDNGLRIRAPYKFNLQGAICFDSRTAITLYRLLKKHYE